VDCAPQLSLEEKKKALDTWEQDARQLVTASNEGMEGEAAGPDRDVNRWPSDGGDPAPIARGLCTATNKSLFSFSFHLATGVVQADGQSRHRFLNRPAASSV
jgi:hypothetical protein